MKKIAILLSIIALAFVSCNNAEEQASQQNTTSNCAWEYKVIKLSGKELATQTEAINQLSREGWEMVDTFSQIGTSITSRGYSEYINVQTVAVSYVFKRPATGNHAAQMPATK